MRGRQRRSPAITFTLLATAIAFAAGTDKSTADTRGVAGRGGGGWAGAGTEEGADFVLRSVKVAPACDDEREPQLHLARIPGVDSANIWRL